MTDKGGGKLNEPNAFMSLSSFTQGKTSPIPLWEVSKGLNHWDLYRCCIQHCSCLWNMKKKKKKNMFVSFELLKEACTRSQSKHLSAGACFYRWRFSEWTGASGRAAIKRMEKRKRKEEVVKYGKGRLAGGVCILTNSCSAILSLKENQKEPRNHWSLRASVPSIDHASRF